MATFPRNLLLSSFLLADNAFLRVNHNSGATRALRAGGRTSTPPLTALVAMASAQPSGEPHFLAHFQAGASIPIGVGSSLDINEAIRRSLCPSTWRFIADLAAFGSPAHMVSKRDRCSLTT